MSSSIVELLNSSTATIIDERGSERTPAEILAAGSQLATNLAAAGIGRGDRVAVQMPNGPLYLDLLAGAAVGGFVLMSVNQRFAASLSESLIERSGSKLVIRSADDLPAHAPARTQPDIGPEDRFVIFTTSGTTSAPKLVVHQQRSIAEHATDVAARVGYDRDSVVMVPLPLCGVFGFTVLWAALAGDSTVIMPSRFDAEETGSLIEQHGVTSMHGSDDMFHRLLATDHDLSSISGSGYGRFNSALDGVVERCDERGVELVGLYGMSEVQALFAYRGGLGLPLEERWQAGGPVVSTRGRSRVVDDELQVQGPSLFEGYLADGGADIDEQLTAAHFDGPWFCTGDLAREDGDNSFEYITRIGDVMRLGGFLVAPAEVEAVLMELPEIDQAQVVAVSLEAGSRPVAFVILAGGASLDEAAAIAHCQARLAKFKSPIAAFAVDEFPVTDGPNGVKIQRGELRQMASERLDR